MSQTEVTEEAQPEYDTKTVVFRDPEEDFGVTLMVTRVRVNGADHLAAAGFHSERVIFAVIDGGVQVASGDPHDRALHKGNTRLRSFLQSIKKGVESSRVFGIGWDQLQEGFEYTPAFIEGMT